MEPGVWVRGSVAPRLAELARGSSCGWDAQIRSRHGHDLRYQPDVTSAYRAIRDEVMDGHMPPMTYIVCAGLAAPGMLVEIEGEAVQYRAPRRDPEPRRTGGNER